MTTHATNRNSLRPVLLAVLVCCALFAGLFAASDITADAENGPSSSGQPAEITLVSRDKTDLKFIYLSGIVMNNDIGGISYDETTNTLTLKNVDLSNNNLHYSLTITNMGEDFKLNVVGTNALDYLSLVSNAYDTGCTITGYGTLNVGYLDVSSDGKKMNVLVDDTLTFNADSAKMGYDNLPAIKITSKTQLEKMETMVNILGNSEETLVYEETPAVTSYVYETKANTVNITPNRVVKAGENGIWGYYVNDKLDTSYNGLAGNEFGTWKITAGLVDFQFTGLYITENGTYMMNEGKFDVSFNGLVPNQYGSWFVRDGMVQFGYTGAVAINGEIFSIDKGQVK